MKSRTWMWMTVVYLFTVLAMPVWTAAQDNPSQDHKSKHHQYKLIDLGTLGGPNSFFTSIPTAQTVNNRGQAAGNAETTIPDPYYPNCFSSDCLINHTFKWKNGVLTDMGSLPGANNSFPTWINGRGLMVGGSDDGTIDPLTGGPGAHAVVWKDDEIIDLGTFGGTQSQAEGVNDRGQVIGGALNTIADPFEAALITAPTYYLFFPGTTQVHAFLWQDGNMQDLNTLGGPDSIALFVNQQGQIAGESYINNIPNGTTGIPTLDPFLWEDGTMKDLGTLGGTVGFPWAINDRGQVVGQSNLAGDMTFHPFFWDKNKGLSDLGTLGGSIGHATYLNDAGEVVGVANLPGDTGHDAFLWKNGVMSDLGNLGKTSFAYAINSGGAS